MVNDERPQHYGFYNDWDLQPLAIYNPWVNGFGIV